MLAKTMTGIPVRCTPDETAKFFAPPGMSCVQYAGAFAKEAGGYLLNPESNGTCEYCMFSVGDDYLKTLNVTNGEAWRDFGIFLVFVISNWALVYFFIYTVRIKGWSFGCGYVFGQLGKLVDLMKKPFNRFQHKEEVEEQEKGE